MARMEGEAGMRMGDGGWGAESGGVPHGMTFYREAGILVIQSRRPRTGGVVLDLDEALAILRAVVEAA